MNSIMLNSYVEYHDQFSFSQINETGKGLFLLI